MIIEKTAIRQENGLRKIFYYDSARIALEKILSYYAELKDIHLLLPGYIGFSTNEGSGIYDPVINTGIKHSFYRLNRDLSIDRKDFASKLKKYNLTIVLLVHYFGYPDINIKEILTLCKSANAIVIEDCAHALYTDFIDHSCGEFGDYAIYSIHKMLPYKKGGFLKVNKKNSEEKENYLKKDTDASYASIFNYDFNYIAQKRKRNAILWEELLKEHQKQLDIMHRMQDYINMDVTPQSFPIIIKKYNRTDLYYRLNNAGFGAISLYHTMIQPIQIESDLCDALWLSEHIINLPVHQDIEEKQIVKMCRVLLEIIR